jgi:hypothetical protein
VLNLGILFFYAQEEALSSLIMWIKLPNPPLEFWSDPRLKSIGDVLEKFIALDTIYKSNNCRSATHILLDLD